MNEVQSKKRLFKCSDCEKSFTQQAHLSIHQRKHTGERPYVCGFAGCSKSFTQLGNLKTHERKHTGERPFACSHPGCGKRFSQLGNMKTHEQLHKGIKPFKCNVADCEKSFTQLGNLKSHKLKVHVKEDIPQSQLPPRKRKISFQEPETVAALQKRRLSTSSLAITREESYSREKEILVGIKAILSKQE